MALAFRPLLSDSSMKSKYGSQALLVGQRPGNGTGAESGDTVGRFWRRSASASVDRSGDTSLAGFAGARRPQPPGARMAIPAALRLAPAGFRRMQIGSG